VSHQKKNVTFFIFPFSFLTRYPIIYINTDFCFNVIDNYLLEIIIKIELIGMINNKKLWREIKYNVMSNL